MNDPAEGLAARPRAFAFKVHCRSCSLRISARSRTESGEPKQNKNVFPRREIAISLRSIALRWLVEGYDIGRYLRILPVAAALSTLQYCGRDT
jgi:hypothetical protein